MSGIDIALQYKSSIGVKDDWGIQSYKDPHQYIDIRKMIELKKSHQKKSAMSNINSARIKKSYFQQIQQLSKNIPGPGHYSANISPKKLQKSQKKDINLNIQSKNFLTELMKLKFSIPGVGKYNISSNALKKKKGLSIEDQIKHETMIQKIIEKRFSSDYESSIGPGLYNNHNKQIGKQLKKIKFLPQKVNHSKIPLVKLPNVNSYTPIPIYYTFQKSLKQKKRSQSQSKLAKQHRFYNPQDKKAKIPSPAEYNLIADWGSQNNKKNKRNIFKSISTGINRGIYH